LEGNLTDNAVAGWRILSIATIKTFGDNNFDGNGSDLGTLTPIAKQ